MSSTSPSPDPLLEALKAVPAAAPETEAKLDDRGVLHLRRPMPAPRGWLRFFKSRQWIRVELDERGAWFWERMDGRHSLAVLARAMTRQFRIDADEARAAVVAFTKMLMLRHLVVLRTTLPKGRTL
jgi:hypothetical protein